MSGENLNSELFIECVGMNRILLVPVASPMHDSMVARSILDEYRRRLEGFFDDALSLITESDQLNGLKLGGDYLAVVVPLTGGTEHIIQGVFEKLSERGFLLLAPHPAMNSLPAALEAFSALRGSGRAWIIAEWPPGHGIKKFLRAWRAVQEIRVARIGLIGEPSPWLVYSSGAVVEEGLREIFQGLSLIRIDLEELYREMESAGDYSPHYAVKEIMGRARSIQVPRSEVEKSLKVYLALRRLFEKYQLDAASIRCFDLIGGAGTTTCLATSILNSEMMIVGCEGDLPALITMLLFSKLAGSPAFMGNLAWIEDEAITIAHCSAPLSILESFELDTHYESRRGVGVRGRFAEGQVVTLGRLDPATRTLRYIIGRVLKQAARENACRTQVRVEVRGAASELIEEAIGNHYVMVLGDVSGELACAARIMNMRSNPLFERGR
ncbi:MAG: hypothetical protein QXK53_07465 [Nitrososphaerota archaeon]